MLRLLSIEFYKLKYSRTFWIICALFVFLIIIIPASISGFLNTVRVDGGNINGFDPTKIPVLHFPDIWQNVIYIYGFIRIFMGILVIISVTNEYSFRTVRQNIIDGFSREDFILSKLITFFVISLITALLVFGTITITGIMKTPEVETGDIFYGLQFVGAFFLELFTYMALALLISVLTGRTGLSIVLLLLSTGVEYIIGFNIPEYMIDYLPMHAIENLVTFPYSRYALQEIQDYVSLNSFLIVLAYLVLFISLSFAKLKSTDI